MSATPSGADVHVNGEHRGKTPRAIENLLPTEEVTAPAVALTAPPRSPPRSAARCEAPRPPSTAREADLRRSGGVIRGACAAARLSRIGTESPATGAGS